MKDKSDSDYDDFISYLRHVCYNPRCFPDVEKARKMVASGELKSIDEAKEWLKNEWNKFEPIRKDNDIALSGSDEEVIELAKRLCPKLLEQLESE